MPINKQTPLSAIIDDFVNSNDPKFSGKTKEERITQAKGAYYAMQKESIEKLVSQISEKSDDAIDTLHSIMLTKIANKLQEKKQEVMEGAFSSGSLKPSKSALDQIRKIPSKATVITKGADGKPVKTVTHTPGKLPSTKGDDESDLGFDDEYGEVRG